MTKTISILHARLRGKFTAAPFPSQAASVFFSVTNNKKKFVHVVVRINRLIGLKICRNSQQIIISTAVKKFDIQAGSSSRRQTSDSDVTNGACLHIAISLDDYLLVVHMFVGLTKELHDRRPRGSDQTTDFVCNFIMALFLTIEAIHLYHLFCPRVKNKQVHRH